MLVIQLSSFPSSYILPRDPQGWLRSYTLLDKTISCEFVGDFLPSKSLVKEPPPLFPQQGPYGERCSVSRANGLFIHLYLSETPVKEPSHKMGENIQSPSTEPHTDRRSTYNGVGLVPQGVCYDTAITTAVPCSLQHDTFHLGLGRPEPLLASMCHNTLNRVST